MTKKQASLCERLKQMGFRQENQMRLYGEIFEFRGDPVVLEDNLVVMEAYGKRRPLGRLNVALRVLSFPTACGFP